MIQSRKVLPIITAAALNFLSLTFISCSTGHSWKMTERTWGNPSDFLTEMEGDSQTLSDQELKTLIENSFLLNPNLGDRRPRVNVEDQVVTLSGEVSSPRSRNSIVAQVKAINSVKGIKNLMHAVPTGTRYDPQLSKEARLALALNSNLVGENIDVSVTNGIIYLTGKVEEISQKELASRIVALGRGTFLIKNYIRIASSSEG
jgi:osmotically-inducible protein OsmY